MHRFQKWRDLLQAAKDVGEVERLMRQYVQVIPPNVVQAMPPDCQKAMADPDVQSAAVTLLHCELAFNGEPATAELLHEIAHTFAAASTRITRLNREPLTPATE